MQELDKISHSEEGSQLRKMNPDELASMLLSQEALKAVQEVKFSVTIVELDRIISISIAKEKRRVSRLVSLQLIWVTVGALAGVGTNLLFSSEILSSTYLVPILSLFIIATVLPFFIFNIVARQERQRTDETQKLRTYIAENADKKKQAAEITPNLLPSKGEA